MKVIRIQSCYLDSMPGDALNTFAAEVIVDKILGYAEFEFGGRIFTEIYTAGRPFIAMERLESFSSRLKAISE
jgi:hypothetical protein